jgi:effector-binding domain-containing protein
LVVVFHDEGYHNENLDIEIGFTADVDAIPLADGRSMSRRRLPALEQVASTVHTGPWLTLSQGYAFLGTWIANNGYRIVGPGREVFHHIDWENNNQTTVTELMFPVARP